ncbi:MAG TPA: FtsX-like permease family protein [Acidimicrobiales bacterium]
MLTVTFADLRFRARQFLIAIVGVGLVLGLALALSGMADGFRAEVAGFVDNVGASSWVMSTSAHGRVTSFAAFPEAEVAAVAHQAGVRDTAPLLFAAAQVVRVGSETALQQVNLAGVVPGGLGDPVVTDGHSLTGGDQVVADTKLGAAVGSTITLGGHPYEVVGTVAGRTMNGGVPMIYMPLAAAQRSVTGGKPLVTAILTTGTPSHMPAGLVALTPDAVINDTVNQLTSAISSIDNTRSLMWFVAAAIVASMLYVAALERKRDFAVLKALGSSSAALFMSLVLEAVVVTLLAAFLAEILASLLTPLFAQPVDITLDARAALPVVALVVGVLASVTALRRVTGADPATAFA